MSGIQKIRDMRMVAFCVLLACFCALVSFQVAYAAPAPNSVTLKVEQVFTQPAASSATDTFTYRLTANETGNPMPQGSSGDVYTFTIDGTDTIDIDPITYDHAGVYTYELEQVIGAEKPGYTYDKQIYTVKVYIKNGSGGLEQEVVLAQKANGNKDSALIFKNSYAYLASDPSLMVDPPVSKTVAGNPSTKGTFTFKLEAKDKTNPMPTGSSDGVKLMTIMGSGAEDFGTWNYTEAGTYFYTISEVNNAESGYTYDSAIYTITDVVKAKNGQLVLDRTVTNASNKQVSSCDFINQYTDPIKSGVEGPQTGDDSMVGFYQTTLVISAMGLIACVAYLVVVGNRRKKSSLNI